MPPRKLRRTPEERALRHPQRMVPGTLQGRSESAAFVRLQQARVTQTTPAATGGHTHDGSANNSVVVGGVNELDPGKAVASQTKSVAIGDYAQALAQNTVAIGSGTAQSNGTVDFNDGAWAGDDSAIAIGNAVAYVGAIAIGQRSGAVTDNSVAIGIDAFAGNTYNGTQLNCVALGNGAFAGHSSAVALGHATSTTAVDQIHMGAKHIELRVPFSATPGTPANNYLRLYVKDLAGETRLYYKSDVGTEYGPL